jgi:hypothetical protein
MQIERAEKKREKMAHRRCKNPARATLLVDGELAPVRHDDEEDVEAMQKRSVSLKTWSASLISSYGEVEVRLKTTAASVVVGRPGPL